MNRKKAPARAAMDELLARGPATRAELLDVAARAVHPGIASRVALHRLAYSRRREGVQSPVGFRDTTDVVYTGAMNVARSAFSIAIARGAYVEDGGLIRLRDG